MDTESPVVWPSWCYAADGTGTPSSRDQSEAGASIAATANSKWASTVSTRKRRHHHSHHQNEKVASSPPSADYTNNNNNTSTSNNNHVKNERLSPGTPDTSSRSVTPSSASHPDTPPADSFLAGRNYSDFMRHLAAKYNNVAPNDYFSTRQLCFSLDATRFKQFKEEAKKEAPPQSAASMLLNPFSGFPPLIDMSSTQALLAMVRTAKEAELQTLLKSTAKVGGGSAGGVGGGRSASETSSPLDLSSAACGSLPPPAKKHKSGRTLKRAESESPKLNPPLSTWTVPESVASWSVEDVCNFVQSIDICAEYVQNFRDQRIDGSGLPLLTEEHLTTTMNMKLGPALKLRSLLAKKTGSCTLCLHCTHCHNSTAASGQNNIGQSLPARSFDSPDSNTGTTADVSATTASAS